MENHPQKPVSNIPSEEKTNSKAIWALVLGILGILGIHLLSFIALALGIISLKEINETKEKGYGMGTTGIILAILGILADLGQAFM